MRNVLENPSRETARAYVTWSKHARDKLAEASKYIAQATREMNAEPVSPNSTHKIDAVAASGIEPGGLYYFFSPDNRSALADVSAVNKIFQDGRLGVVGIPVGGRNEEIFQFLNETKPLFPIRRSDGEVQLVKPTETPNLCLALLLEKKIFRLGSTITETAIVEAIGGVMANVRGITATNVFESAR